ncbi:hypothetical protein ACN2WE_40680 [Streptomyces sp. cg28]
MTAWVATKMRWQLAVDAVEKAELLDELAQCPDKSVKNTLAR